MTIHESYAISLTLKQFNSLTMRISRVAAFFSTTGCSDCDKMSPLWHALEVKYTGSMRFIEVEYGLMTSEIFDKYNILETPTFILFVGGANVSRHDGLFASPTELEQFLQSAYGTDHAKQSAFSQLYLPPVSEIPSSLISVLLGISVFASPCVLPMMPGYISVILAKDKKNGPSRCAAFVSSLVFGAAGILLVGVLFVIVGDVLWSLLLMGRLLVVFALLALGLAMLLNVSILSSSTRIINPSRANVHAKSIAVYSFLFGFLSMSCSLPLLAGAVLNIVSGVDIYSMTLRLMTFTAGFAFPLAVLTFTIGTGQKITASKLSRLSDIISRIGGLSMVAASMLVLLNW